MNSPRLKSADWDIEEEAAQRLFRGIIVSV